MEQLVSQRTASPTLEESTAQAMIKELKEYVLLQLPCTYVSQSAKKRMQNQRSTIRTFGKERDCSNQTKGGPGEMTTYQYVCALDGLTQGC